MSRVFIGTLTGLILGCSAAAVAQSPGAPGTIADNEGLFVDGSAFRITAAKIKGDAAIPIETAGAQEMRLGRDYFPRERNALHRRCVATSAGESAWSPERRWRRRRGTNKSA